MDNKTEQYKCQSYYNDDNVLVDCSCGKCGEDKKQRTKLQNRSMHKWFTMFAEELNDAGLDQRKVLKKSVNIPWTMEAFKNQIWRPIQIAMFDKESTTEITTKQFTEIEKVITREMAEKHGMTVEFPSIESIVNKQRMEE